MLTLISAIMNDKKQFQVSVGKTSDILDENIGIYERDGIKFMYMPLSKSIVEGSASSTHLRATKGIDSYSVEFRSDQLGQVIPFAVGNIDMFNKIMTKYLSDRLECKSQTKITDEFILINIELEAFEINYNIKIKLLKEKVDEQMLIKRKLAYLVEKVTWYENTINYYFYSMKDMKFVNSKWEKLELPYYMQNGYNNQMITDYSSKIYKQFIESKTEGLFAEISNWNLHILLLRNSTRYGEEFKLYQQKITQTPAEEKNTQHPLTNICNYDWTEYIKVMLLILNHAGYELMDNITIARQDLYAKDGQNNRKTVIVKIAKTNANYKYTINNYQNIDSAIKDYSTYFMIHDTNQIMQIVKIKN